MRNKTTRDFMNKTVITVNTYPGRVRVPFVAPNDISIGFLAIATSQVSFSRNFRGVLD